MTTPRHRILIVEDDDRLRAELLCALEEYTTVVVSDSPAALSTLSRDADFDLIIASIEDRSLGGIELLRVLRTRTPRLADRIICRAADRTNTNSARSRATARRSCRFRCCLSRSAPASNGDQPSCQGR